MNSGGGIFHIFWQAARPVLAAALLLAITTGQGSTQTPGGAASKQTRNYDIAIQRQNDQIASARAQSRKAGCGLALFGRSAAICSDLKATLARMEKNLGQLQSKRAQLARNGDVSRKHPVTRQVRAQEKPQTPSQTSRPRNVSGRLRTLCVRTCDGYYFPVSWSVSQAAFGRDGKACEAMCPGTNVELYYHRVAGEEPENMVSAITGLPYSASETAFLYKKPGMSTPAGCSCGATADGINGFQTIGGDYKNNYPGNNAGGSITPDKTLTAAIPRPYKRPDPAEDPETLATRDGGLDAAALKALATPAPASTPGKLQAPRQIRVVGPVFLPAPEAVEDQPVPAPARVP